MGIRSEIKDVIKLYSGCVVDHHAALRAISEIVHRPKPPKPEQAEPVEIVFITTTKG